jgi:type IV fimbrial biogenesis protein FimT
MLKPARGFSLIELMIIIVIMGILLVTAVPNLSKWVANSRVRSAAESLQNGLRLAQAEAVRRSRQVVFVLTTASPALSAAPAVNGSNWYIQALPLSGSGSSAASSDFVRGEAFSTQQSVSVTGGAAICFNSAGRLVDNTATGLSNASGAVSCSAPTASSTDYVISASGSDRPLTVQVSPGGKVRMCDQNKSLSSSQADGCTAAASSSSSAASSS